MGCVWETDLVGGRGGLAEHLVTHVGLGLGH